VAKAAQQHTGRRKLTTAARTRWHPVLYLSLLASPEIDHGSGAIVGGIRDKKEEPMRFRIVTASGGYRAHMVAGNGELVWWTEVYTTKAAARHAIELAKSAYNAPVYDLT